MKKCLFCLVLMLCIALCASAWAEGAKCCQCCCSPQSAPSAEEAPDGGFEYTLEIELEGFTVYLPAEFKEYPWFPFNYVSDDTRIYVNLESSPHVLGDPYYEDLDEWRQAMEDEYIDVDSSDDISHRIFYVDNLAAIAAISQRKKAISFVDKDMDEHTMVNLLISNREDWLSVNIYSETRDKAEQLAEGIASHVVLTNTAE